MLSTNGPRERDKDSESNAAVDCDVSEISILGPAFELQVICSYVTHFSHYLNLVFQVYDRLEEVVASPDFLHTIDRARVGGSRSSGGNCSTQLVDISGQQHGSRPITGLNEQHFQTVSDWGAYEALRTANLSSMVVDL